MDSQTYRLIAIQIGDALKYSTSINEIDRAAKSVFSFNCEDFPNDSISSTRAQKIHDWILTLAKQKLTPDERNKLLFNFLDLIVTDENKEHINDLLIKAGISDVSKKQSSEFTRRKFHPEIVNNCSKLYFDGHYFHTVFEAAKIYHQNVQAKSQSVKEGQDLMLQVWNPEKGTLKVTKCISSTDKNVQEGIAFLSAGLMRAIRNPTAHEPAHLWPITKEECLDILSFVSFLMNKLDEAVYFGPNFQR
jgi:uncharacterized protein (TIGR02391 family)